MRGKAPKKAILKTEVGTICLGSCLREWNVEDCRECIQFLSTYDSRRLDPRFTRMLVKATSALGQRLNYTTHQRTTF